MVRGDRLAVRFPRNCVYTELNIELSPGSKGWKSNEN
jgi:hypothetical protein